MTMRELDLGGAALLVLLEQTDALLELADTHTLRMLVAFYELLQTWIPGLYGTVTDADAKLR